MMATRIATDWQVDADRTLAVSGPAVIARGLGAAPVPLVWPAMASGDALDFALDLAPWLTPEGDGLASVQVTAPTPVLATDLAVLWCSILAGCPVLFLAGGAPGTQVALQVVMISTLGRRLSVHLVLPINTDSLAVAPPAWPQLTLGTVTIGIPPNALSVPSGAILVDAAGLPFLLA